MNGTNHPEISSTAVVAGMLTNLLLLMILLPYLGIYGAAAAMTGSYFVSSIFLIVSFKKLSCMHFRDIIIFRKEDRTLIRWLIEYGKKKVVTAKS
jgi:O-antigen/teichoic acid export membrane protein